MMPAITDLRLKKPERAFHLTLLFSLLLHTAVIAWLSSAGIKRFVKPVKQIEVTYTNVRTRKIVKENVRSQAVEIVRQDQPSRKVELLPKDGAGGAKVLEKVFDIAKTRDRFYYEQKLPEKMISVDPNRKISVPVLQAEKITNPKYIGYNQAVHKKMYETAQQYVDHPDIAEVGDVYFKFILRADGTLAEVRVLTGLSSHNAKLQKLGEDIIRKSQPFPPFPAGLDYPEMPFNMVISFAVAAAPAAGGDLGVSLKE